jgi:hypothetical protein
LYYIQFILIRKIDRKKKKEISKNTFVLRVRHGDGRHGVGQHQMALYSVMARKCLGHVTAKSLRLKHNKNCN